ncbi:Retrovirus-related Pol polyprotein from transposon TNT 1-94 [Araneus ventricosus]|uniref:Retrovirus-related Pol polyprotein from transposon TNT 1-94 n=1 Tax=Araneus ventricosus TaxID=182803 RepID=A0A4Y2KWD0_ARAVE|nr:Retrovirus-related Pol polyprotein from transposon TNT 1-94 [Araneus ventricosus]
MKEEIQVIKERKVWDLVPKPPNGKVIGCRWVYTLKQDERDVIVRYKARLVAQGFGQIQGIHYDEIFNPVVLGKTRKLLGVEFEEMGNELFIHQSEYIHKVCEKYQCFNYPVTSLPIAVGIVLSKTQCPSTEVEISEISKFPYRNLLGCLYFISGRTRPDICYAVNILSQFQSNPGLVHWNKLLKLHGYVTQTKNYKLKLSETNNLNINCYSDADFAANRDDRISIGGLILFIDNSPIIWKTFKQKCVSLSTMESE